MLIAKDTLNRTTTYAYYATAAFSGTAPNETGHAAGDLQTSTNSAGHVTQFTLYDRAGRVRQMVDPKGVVTDIVYTPRGWTSSVTVTPPGGNARTTAYTYDNAGQMTGTTLPAEGGRGASVRPISPSDNRGAGACVGAQCRGLPDGTRIRIIPSF
jgi:YD repeat-containing protein